MNNLLAGIFKISRPIISLKTTQSLPTHPKKITIPPSRQLSSSTSNLTMASNTNSSPTVQDQEPTPNIPKFSPHENNNGTITTTTTTTHFHPLLKIKKLSENAILPTRGSPLAAGYDLSSAVDIKVEARGKALVPTDLSIAIPEGTYARIAPRSGLALKHSIDVGAGVIDADYRGPVGVILFNFSDVDFEVKKGDRVAQMIIERIMAPDVVEVEDLDATARGEGGFGSTGVSV